MFNMKSKFLFVDDYDNHWQVYWSFAKIGDSATAGIDNVSYEGTGSGDIRYVIPPKYIPEALIDDMEFELGLVIEKEIGIDCRNVRIERKK